MRLGSARASGGQQAAGCGGGAGGEDGGAGEDEGGGSGGCELEALPEGEEGQWQGADGGGGREGCGTFITATHVPAGGGGGGSRVALLGGYGGWHPDEHLAFVRHKERLMKEGGGNK